MIVNEIRVERRYEALAATLREQILNGDILPGQNLPNERELVDLSGLSRGSVREALRVLEAQGLVSTSVGRATGGRKVVQPSADLVRESLDVFVRGQQVTFPVLMETIEALEPSLAALAATHRTAEDLDRIRSLTDKLRLTKSAKRFLAANAAWHAAVACSSHNPILVAIYQALSPALLDPHVAGFASHDVRQAVVYVAGRIEDAIIAGDGERARRRMQRHVEAYRRLVEPLAPDTVTLTPFNR